MHEGVFPYARRAQDKSRVGSAEALESRHIFVDAASE